MPSVLGVDACKAGWCAASMVREDGSWQFRDVLQDRAVPVCVDIPVGLLDEPGHRFCDKEARKRLGPRRGPSVFPPPSRAALLHRDYASASRANFRVTGRRLSKQSFAISQKIAEVDSVMTADLQRSVREVHPELCFWGLSGGRPPSHNKKTLAGRTERWGLLLRALPTLPPEPTLLEIPPGCALDDVIDALAAALTAACILDECAQVIPTDSQVDARGLRMEMWFPSVRSPGLRATLRRNSVLSHR